MLNCDYFFLREEGMGEKAETHTHREREREGGGNRWTENMSK